MLEGKLAAIERKIAGIVRAIEDGLYQPSMKARLAQLEAEKTEAMAELTAMSVMPPVALHPNLPALYRRKVEELERLLADAELGVEVAEAIRSLISRIVLTPRAGGGVEAVLEGDLARILAIAERGRTQQARRVSGGPGGDSLGSQVSVVAGARNQLKLLLRAAALAASPRLGRGSNPFACSMIFLLFRHFRTADRDGCHLEPVGSSGIKA